MGVSLPTVFVFYDGTHIIGLSPSLRLTAHSTGNILSPVELAGNAAVAHPSPQLPPPPLPPPAPPAVQPPPPPPPPVAFTAAPDPDWRVDPSFMGSSSSVAAIVRVNGVAQSSGKLGVFQEGIVRGVRDSAMPIPFGPNAGEPVFFLTVFTSLATTRLCTFQFYVRRKRRARPPSHFINHAINALLLLTARAHSLDSVGSVTRAAGWTKRHRLAALAHSQLACSWQRHAADRAQW